VGVVRGCGLMGTHEAERRRYVAILRDGGRDEWVELWPRDDRLAVNWETALPFLILGLRITLK